ncbi:MAG: exodeoxyribonuclease VII small subunit [Clostridia bacterium]|nr:exodeoxyribonuclease VII small subunit [Clostridia bacterium]
MAKKISFEENIKKLDEIVKALERGDLPLDDMIKLFEQGAALSKQCKKTLDEAQLKVRMLLSEEGTASGAADDEQ